jgi:hypothetical protein
MEWWEGMRVVCGVRVLGETPWMEMEVCTEGDGSRGGRWEGGESGTRISIESRVISERLAPVLRKFEFQFLCPIWYFCKELMIFIIMQKCYYSLKAPLMSLLPNYAKICVALLLKRSILDMSINLQKFIKLLK